MLMNEPAAQDSRRTEADTDVQAASALSVVAPAAASSLGGDTHLGGGGADVGVHVGLERDEVLLEHGDEASRGLVELRLVLPGLVRIEQMRLDAGELGRHLSLIHI